MYIKNNLKEFVYLMIFIMLDKTIVFTNEFIDYT